MSICQDLNLALKTLRKLNKIIDGPAMLHNDQGALYTSLVFRKEAQKYGIAQSYSRKGNCWDYSAMETWIGMPKTGCLSHPSFFRVKKIVSPKQAMKEVRAYCRYYNTKRIEAKLGYPTPLKFR